MLGENVSFTTAFLAGLISFFSPCILPLVPVYLGYMTGQMASGGGARQRLHTFLHALFFVGGFSLVFVALGATAGLLGAIVAPLMPYIVKVGGVLLIVFGLHLIGLISIPFLNMEKRLDMGPARQPSYWSSLVVGIVFAAGWTPCVGPVLSAILLMAADTQTVTAGAALLTAYALGLGVPFLVVAVALDAVRPAISRMGRLMRVASIVGGVLLIVMGFLMITGLFESMLFWVNSTLSPSW